MSVVHTAACIALGYAWPRPVCVCGLQAARVYTAGPDGRCTVCQRPEAEHAPEAWTADARACPPEVTAETVTDKQIRDENRANPTMLDRLMVAIHSTDHELRVCARAEFAAAINARANGVR